MRPRLRYIVMMMLLLGIIVTLRFFDPSPIKHLRHITFDGLQYLSPRLAQISSPVRIIDIDQESLDKVGSWPWPRTHIATLISQLRKNNAAVIGVPLLFEGADPLSPSQIIKQLPLNSLDTATTLQLRNLPQNDNILAKIIQKSPVIMGYMPVKSSRHGTILSSPYQLSLKPNPTHTLFSSFTKVHQSLALFNQKSKGIGVLPILTSSKQSVQAIPILVRNGKEIYPSFSAEMLRIAQGASDYGILSQAENTSDTQSQVITGLKIGDLSLPINEKGQLLFHSRKTDKSRYIPAWKILRNGALHSEIEGRLIIIGSSLSQIMPQVTTSLEQNVSQAELIAQSLEQVLQQHSLQRSSYSYLIEIGVVIIGGLLILFGLFYFSALSIGLLTMGTIGLFTAVSYYLFKSQGLLIDPIFPSMSLLVMFVVARFSHLIPVRQERDTIQKVFAQKLPVSSIQKISQNQTAFSRDGKYADLPILSMHFIGLENINTSLQPNHIAPMIRQLSSQSREVIFDHGGLIDYQSGDHLRACWDQPDQDAVIISDKTLTVLCETALELSQETTLTLATLPLQNHKAQPPISSIILTTGHNWIGDSGANGQPNYTIFGKTNTTLIQLQAIACHYKVPILATKTFAEKVNNFSFLPFPTPADKSAMIGDFVYILLGHEQTNAYRKTFKMLENLHFRLLDALKENDKKSAQTLVDQCLPLARADLKTAYQQLKSYI